MNAQKTFQPKPESLPEKWYVVDASNQILGRLASRVAKVLRGKTSPQYAPHVSLNTHIIVVNAEKVLLTGKKVREKTYKWHTAYRTGLKEESVEHLLARKPTEVVRRAIKGMVPKDALGRKLMRYIRIYTGPEHPHKAQCPEPLTIATRRMRTQE
jgi:large subunit ribosomal protein L13